jgi:hypothetical protein
MIDMDAFGCKGKSFRFKYLERGCGFFCCPLVSYGCVGLYHYNSSVKVKFGGLWFRGEFEIRSQSTSFFSSFHMLRKATSTVIKRVPAIARKPAGEPLRRAPSAVRKPNAAPAISRKVTSEPLKRTPEFVKKEKAPEPLGYTVLYKDEHIIALDTKPGLDSRALLASKPEGIVSLELSIQARSSHILWTNEYLV